MLKRLWAADAHLEVISRLADNRAFWDQVVWPGLIGSNAEIANLLDKLPRRLRALFYKRRTDVAWVVLLGGTGTGKSTVFNLLCGADLSATGVERPKTSGPIAFAHEDAEAPEGFPLSIGLDRVKATRATWQQREGSPGSLLLIEHRSPTHRHFVLVDTPDIDSVEVSNRAVVEEMVFLSDLIMFVTSQEKYADEVPFRYLKEVVSESKRCLAVLNKADSSFTADDLDASLRELGVDLGVENILTLPYTSGNPSDRMRDTAPFVLLRRSLHDVLSPANLDETLRRQRAVEAQQIRKMASRLFVLMDQERRATKQWEKLLDNLFESACRDLLAEQEQHFQSEGRAYLQKEIRKHFAKYDLLRGPRRLLSSIVIAPLKALGLVEPRERESREEALLRIRKRLDVMSIRYSTESFCRTVLERLCPIDADSALAKRLRAAQVHLTPDEIERIIEKEQEDLVRWLQETFDRMGQGISKGKEWGIYSTSILWGALILTVETAIGGGISVLEAVLDSAVAPFVTQGAAELFAYRELQVIAQQLSIRCRRAFTCVLRVQRDRYLKCIESVTPSYDVMASIEGVVSGIH